MAERAKVELRNIRRLNQFTDKRAMEQTEVTVLENAILNREAGRAIKRGAVVKSDVSFLSLSPFKIARKLLSIQIEGVDYIVAKFGSDLYSHTGGVWTLLTGPAWTALNETAKIQTQIFANRFYITDGVTAPRYTDMSTGADMEIDPMDITGIKGYNGPGGNLTSAKNYKYVITYRMDTGEESAPSQPFTHFIELYNEYSTNAVNKSLKFTDIPVGTDSRINSKAIYRTEGNSNIYYYWGFIANEITEFTDTKADTDLDKAVIVKSTNIPTMCKDFASHRERLFTANVTLTQQNFTSIPADPTDGLAPIDDWVSGYAFNILEYGSGSFVNGTYNYKFVLKADDGLYSNVEDMTGVAITTGPVGLLLFNPPLIYDGKSVGQTIEVYRQIDAGSWLLHEDLSGLLNNAKTNQIRQGYADTVADLTGAKVWMEPTYEDLDFPNSVSWSEIGQPLNIQAKSLIRVFPDDGDTITAIYDDRDGLIVFKQNSICKVFTQGNPTNWRSVKLTEEVGCDNIDSIIKTEDRYYFQQFGQVYMYPALADALSLPVSDELTEDDIIVETSYSSQNHWLLISVVNNGNGKLLVYDEVAQSWYVWKFGEFYVPAMCELKHGANRGDIYFCNDSNVQISVYDPTANRDYDPNREEDIDPYQMRIVSKVWLSPDLNYAMRFTKLLSNYKKESGVSVTHIINSEIYTDNTGSGNVFIETADLDLTHVPELQYEISGNGLEEFTYSQIEHYFTRRKLNAIV